MAYMPTNSFANITQFPDTHILLALLNTLFTIRSKLPALKCYSNMFFTILTVDYVA